MNGACTSQSLGGLVAVVAICGASLGATACKCDNSKTPGPAGSASGQPLSPELASKVLARVGKREITLGDYAATLDRMDRFERVRYQTPERRKQLLEELIHAELLAGEARRRGLDRDPRVQTRVRQALRDELLAEVHRTVPGPESISEKDVRKYYTEHRRDFSTPERRRLSAIVTRDRAAAQQALEKARGASPEAWGELVTKYSTREKVGDAGLRGDLGFATATAPDAAEKSSVPDEVRRAGFAIENQGEIFDGVVEAGAEFYVVRLVTKNEAGQRTFAEAERSIRVTLAQRELREAEARLEEELRQRYPVEIDEGALRRVQAPAGKD